jgi:hypothetical protein
VPANLTRARRFFANDRTHDILTSGALADARVLYDARLGRSDFGVWATYPAVAPVLALDTAFASLDLVPHEARVMDLLDTDHRGFAVSYRLTRDARVIAGQRARHDAIRQRQLARILACDDTGSRTATLEWLRAGTHFLGLPGATPVIAARAGAAL